MGFHYLDQHLHSEDLYAPSLSIGFFASNFTRKSAASGFQPSGRSLLTTSMSFFMSFSMLFSSPSKTFCVRLWILFESSFRRWSDPGNRNRRRRESYPCRGPREPCRGRSWWSRLNCSTNWFSWDLTAPTAKCGRRYLYASSLRVDADALGGQIGDSVIVLMNLFYYFNQRHGRVLCLLFGKNMLFEHFGQSEILFCLAH